MITIGITGGYATGKSVVAGMFRKLGAKVVSADTIARTIMKPQTLVWKKVVKCFGKEILRKDKLINRKKLAEIIFTDSVKRQKLNQLVHPAVVDEIKRVIKTTVKRGKPAILAIDAPLLFEAGIEGLFDRIIVVGCRTAVRIDRAKRRDELSKCQIFQRIQSQWSLKRKIKKADFVVDNSGSITRTRSQVNKIWNRMTNNIPPQAGEVL